MEFEDDHDDEQVEEEEEENDDESGQTTPFKIIDAEPITLAPVTTKYRECLKNHAVGIGGHALDGCGEFMQAGPEGSIHALKCAACNCHRNFHRKEVVAHSQLAIYTNSNHSHPQFQPRNQQLKFYPYNRTMITTPSPSAYLQPRPMVLVPPPGFGGDDGGGSSMGNKKRSRTKFTTEQKEKMVEVAEKIGWKIHKEDEEIIQQFCQETGVKRHVFKVWLHNNKHTRGKKETLVLPSP